MATQSQQILSALETLAGNMSKLSERLDAVESGGSQPTPVAAQPTTVKTTASKPGTFKRNLDPIDVAVSDSLVFRVMAANGGGVLTNGSRAVPVQINAEGKERIVRSLPADVIDSLTDAVRTAIRTAMETVDKRALIGAHKPTETVNA